ncbi:MAG: hypothetical protein WB607_04365 [Candidatus Acidiferrum sp.]
MSGAQTQQIPKKIVIVEKTKRPVPLRVQSTSEYVNGGGDHA